MPVKQRSHLAPDRRPVPRQSLHPPDPPQASQLCSTLRVHQARRFARVPVPPHFQHLPVPLQNEHDSVLRLDSTRPFSAPASFLTPLVRSRWRPTCRSSRPGMYVDRRRTTIRDVDGAHDLFQAQRFARHVSPLTTVVYTHPSDEETATSVCGLLCGCVARHASHASADAGASREAATMTS